MAIKATMTVSKRLPSGGDRYLVRGTLTFTGAAGTDYPTGGLTIQYSGNNGALTDLTNLSDVLAKLGLLNKLDAFLIHNPISRASGATAFMGRLSNTTTKTSTCKLQLLGGDAASATVAALAELPNDTAIAAVAYTAEFTAEGF